MCSVSVCLVLELDGDVTHTSTSRSVTHDNARRGFLLKLAAPAFVKRSTDRRFPLSCLIPHFSTAAAGKPRRRAADSAGTAWPSGSKASALRGRPQPPELATQSPCSPACRSHSGDDDGAHVTAASVSENEAARPQTSRVSWGTRGECGPSQRRAPNGRRVGAPVGASTPPNKANQVRFTLSRTSTGAGAVSQMEPSCFCLSTVSLIQSF